MWKNYSAPKQLEYLILFMPSVVNPQKCDGCKGQPQTFCMNICPNDLMAVEETPHGVKAFNREPEMCWECYNCVKYCPQGAIDIRGYADFCPIGGIVTPLRGTDSIMWTIKYRSGALKRFKFPIRRTSWGSIIPLQGEDPANKDLKGEFLVMEKELRRPAK